MDDTAIAKPRPSRSSAGINAWEEAAARRIFIVEDEKAVADNLEELLKCMGYAIAGRALSGEEAIEQVAITRPDLVLMDIRLQGKIDGIEAAQIITGRHEIPIVYLTAHSDRSIQDRIQVTTPFGFILKPFDEGELRMVIEIALRRGSAEAKLKKSNLELQAALSQIKVWNSLLLVCAWCKKVRPEGGYWQPLEEYVTSHSSTRFTHGICPECSARVIAFPRKD